MNDLSNFFGHDYNVDNVETMSFQPLPDCVVEAVITRYEQKPVVSNPEKSKLVLELTVVSENYRNRKLFINLNLGFNDRAKNTPGDVTSINMAKAKLAEIARALNIQNFLPLDPLVGKPFIARVKLKITKREGEEDRKDNEVYPVENPQEAASLRPQTGKYQQQAAYAPAPQQAPQYAPPVQNPAYQPPAQQPQYQQPPAAAPAPQQGQPAAPWGSN